MAGIGLVAGASLLIYLPIFHQVPESVPFWRSPSTWRTVVGLLEQSRTPETRQRRLEKLIERLAEANPAKATQL